VILPAVRSVQLLIALRSDITAAEVFPALAAGGVDAMLLRGPAIAGRLYADGERSYADCDILVPEEQRAALEAVLERLGFEPVSKLSHARMWRRGDAEIDLHTGLLGSHSAPALWRALSAHRVGLQLNGTVVPAPDTAGVAFVVALHAAQHGASLPQTLRDLERAVDRVDLDDWRSAASIAEEAEAFAAFRQGLTMLPQGRARLAELGIAPSVTVRSRLRQRGLDVPMYLLEGLAPRERALYFARRIVPSRTEMAAIDPGAADGTRGLLTAHGRRLARLPGSYARLAAGSLEAAPGPNPTQTLFVRACVLGDREALAGWTARVGADPVRALANEEVADRHLLALLYDAFRDDLPAETASHLRAVVAHEQLRAEGLAEAAADVLGMVREAGIEPVLCGGLAIGTFYREPWLRHSDCVDLLVSPAEAAPARWALRELDSPHGVLRHPSGARVELRTRLYREWWRLEPEVPAVGGMLAPADLLVALCADPGPGLRPYVDAQRIATSGLVEWERVVAHAVRSRHARAATHILGWVDAELGGVPAQSLRRLGRAVLPEHVHAALVSGARRLRR
jgi:hypothetical protein